MVKARVAPVTELLEDVVRCRGILVIVAMGMA
jgi:hypothetical protein